MRTTTHYCKHHTNGKFKPALIPAGLSPIGNNQHVCPVCTRVLETGTGTISAINGTSGTIFNGKKEIVFQLNECTKKNHPLAGEFVQFEALFVDGYPGVEAVKVCTCPKLPSPILNIKPAPSNIENTRDNVNNFAAGYGLHIKSQDINNIMRKEAIFKAGVALLDGISGQPMLTCNFSPAFKGKLFFVPTAGHNLQAYFTYMAANRIDGATSNLRNRKQCGTVGAYYHIEERGFSLRVHSKFRRKGIIRNFRPDCGYGFLVGNAGGIFFHKSWCGFNDIKDEKEVSFIPVISEDRGLQARAIEEI